MTPILFICSDELNRDYLGCSGNEVIQTPNLDALARRGTRFTAAYTPSPICGLWKPPGSIAGCIMSCTERSHHWTELVPKI